MQGNSEQLIIRDYPTGSWLFGLVAGGISVFYYLSEKQPIALAIGGGVLLLSILLASILTIKVDRAAGLLTLTYRFPLWRSVKQIPLSDIVSIQVERNTSSDEDGTSYTYRVVILLKDNQAVPLRSYYSSGAADKEQTSARLREFIGINESGLPALDMLQTALSAVQQGGESAIEDVGEEHITNGVRWTVETIPSLGGLPITRWHSTDLPSLEHFVYVVQKIPGQKSLLDSKWLQGLNKTLLKQSFKIYGFDEYDTPNLERAEEIPADPSLASHFFVYSDDPTTARQILNPWTVIPLVNWAVQHPLSRENTNQLAVLFGPGGLYLAIQGKIEKTLNELATLGAELVLAQGGGK